MRTQTGDLITSSGIIRNAEKPRSGVISGNSVKSWFYDIVHEGIDLDYQEARADLDALRNRLDELDETVDKEEFAALSEQIEEMEQGLENSEGGNMILIGDWTKDTTNLYIPDINGKEGFAATYNRDSNTICVEWSKTVRAVHHTSPCFVMSDGSGPCGDLDTEGDSVLAYALPSDLVGEDD